MKDKEIYPRLKTALAAELFEAVQSLPVIDWHNHLSVSDLACDRQYEDPAALWLLSDPYKHRAMRICGVPEEKITGAASNFEKFEAWCETFPQLVGNPLYFWGILELNRIFGITTLPCRETAHSLWDAMTEKLHTPGFRARGLLEKFHVQYAAPCVGAADDIAGFPELGNIVPSFRGDDLAALTPQALAALEKQAGFPVDSLAALRCACGKLVDLLHGKGCRFADHALDSDFRWVARDGKEEECFARLLANTATAADRQSLFCEVLRILGAEYGKRNWTMQLHVGALRRTSSRLRSITGPAGGYAGIAHPTCAESVVRLLDAMESSDAGLPDVILYTLNPADHAYFAVLSGSFNGPGVRGKVQLGPAWWYCDHAYGIRDCLENIAAYGVLSTFLGMTTDSRSILSFVRHEYFRRILCNWMADKAENDELCRDRGLLQRTAAAICYNNANERIKL